MPHHYKQYPVGSKKYKKAYGEHMVKKLKKKRKKNPVYNNPVDDSIPLPGGGD